MQEKSAIWATPRPLLLGLYAKNRRGGHNVPPPLVIGLKHSWNCLDFSKNIWTWCKNIYVRLWLTPACTWPCPGRRTILTLRGPGSGCTRTATTRSSSTTSPSRIRVSVQCSVSVIFRLLVRIISFQFRLKNMLTCSITQYLFIDFSEEMFSTWLWHKIDKSMNFKSLNSVVWAERIFWIHLCKWLSWNRFFWLQIVIFARCKRQWSKIKCRSLNLKFSARVRKKESPSTTSTIPPLKADANTPHFSYFQFRWGLRWNVSTVQTRRHQSSNDDRSALELETNLLEVWTFTITEKSW